MMPWQESLAEIRDRFIEAAEVHSEFGILIASTSHEVDSTASSDLPTFANMVQKFQLSQMTDCLSPSDFLPPYLTQHGVVLVGTKIAISHFRRLAIDADSFLPSDFRVRPSLYQTITHYFDEPFPLQRWVEFVVINSSGGWRHEVFHTVTGNHCSYTISNPFRSCAGAISKVLEDIETSLPRHIKNTATLREMFMNTGEYVKSCDQTPPPPLENPPPAPTPRTVEPNTAFPHWENYLPEGLYHAPSTTWPLAKRQLRRFCYSLEDADRKLRDTRLPDELRYWWLRQWADGLMFHTGESATVADVRALYEYARKLNELFHLSVTQPDAKHPRDVEFSFYDQPIQWGGDRGNSTRCMLQQLSQRHEDEGRFQPTRFPGVGAIPHRSLGWRLASEQFFNWAGFLCAPGELTAVQRDWLEHITFDMTDWCRFQGTHGEQCQPLGEQVLNRIQAGIERVSDRIGIGAATLTRDGRYSDTLNEVSKWLEQAGAITVAPATADNGTETFIERYRRQVEQTECDRPQSDDENRRLRAEAELFFSDWRSGMAALDNALAPLFAGSLNSSMVIALELRRMGELLVESDERSSIYADQTRILRNGGLSWNSLASKLARLQAFEEVEADFNDAPDGHGHDPVFAATLLRAAVESDYVRLSGQVEWLLSPSGRLSPFGWIRHILDWLGPFVGINTPHDPREFTPAGWRRANWIKSEQRTRQILVGGGFCIDEALFPSLRPVEQPSNDASPANPNSISTTSSLRSTQPVVEPTSLTVSGVSKEPTRHSENSCAIAFEKLAPSRKRAWGLRIEAIRRHSDIDEFTPDQRLYDVLKKDGEDVPNEFKTFTDYLRECRRALGLQKKSPRGGRRSGKSVVLGSEA